MSSACSGMYTNGRFNSRPNFRQTMKKKKGNALAHLEKFTAVQQLAIFAPDLKMTVTQYNEQQYFKASTLLWGEKECEASALFENHQAT